MDATRRLQVAELMQEGLSWLEAIKTAKVKVHRTTAERWFHRLESEGETGLAERRRGSAYKITPKIRAWLEKECRDDTNRTSAELQKVIQRDFQITVTVRQINRVRATLGVSRTKKSVV